MNTKKEIVDRTYYLLGEDQSSTVFDKEGTVVPDINKTLDKICRCNITNIITQQKIRGGILDFLYEERTLLIPRVKKNLEPIDVNSHYIILDSVEGLPLRGYLDINGNIINYDGISLENNAILKVNGINGFHDVNSSLYYGYLLPDNMIKASDFFDITYESPLKFKDFREPRNTWERCYTLKPYKGKKVAVFYNLDNSPVMISYTKRLEPMEKEGDECGLPDNFGVEILPYLVAGQLLIDTSESNKGKDLLNQGYSALEDMYSYYATPTKKFRKKIKTRPLTDNLR